MKKISIVLGLALSLLVVGGVLSPTGLAAQLSADGYGAEPGKVLIVLVPDHLEVGRTAAVQATSKIKGTKAVGKCDKAPLSYQEATFVDRESKQSQKTEVIVLHPANFEIPQDVVVGAFRDSGPCGPGWRILRGHVLKTEY